MQTQKKSPRFTKKSLTHSHSSANSSTSTVKKKKESRSSHNRSNSIHIFNPKNPQISELNYSSCNYFTNTTNELNKPTENLSQVASNSFIDFKCGGGNIYEKDFISYLTSNSIMKEGTLDDKLSQSSMKLYGDLGLLNKKGVKRRYDFDRWTSENNMKMRAKSSKGNDPDFEDLEVTQRLVTEKENLKIQLRNEENNVRKLSDLNLRLQSNIKIFIFLKGKMMN